MTREQASEAILRELNRIGLPNASYRHKERCSLTAFPHNNGEVNVDFHMDDGGVVKICMYVKENGLKPDKMQADLVSIGKKLAVCNKLSFEFGRQGEKRTTDGVLYKLNTCKGWSNLTSRDIADIGKMVRDFVGDVSQVLNKTISGKVSSANIKQPRKRPAKLM